MADFKKTEELFKLFGTYSKNRPFDENGCHSLVEQAEVISLDLAAFIVMLIVAEYPAAIFKWRWLVDWSQKHREYILADKLQYPYILTERKKLCADLNTPQPTPCTS